MSSVLDMTIPKKHREQLERDTQRVQRCKAALDSALHDQAQSIVLVYSSGKASMREVAAIAEVSHQRIAQVIGAFDDEAMKERLSEEIINRGPLGPGE